MSQEKFGNTGINPNRKLRKVVGASVYILFLLSKRMIFEFILPDWGRNN